MTNKKITHKQIEILILLYRFRFLTKQYIQLFLNHKDIRRIKSWLNNLKEQNIIQVKSILEGEENEGKTVYFLSVESRQILKDMEGIKTKELDRIKREREHTDQFINHNLLIADVFLKFRTVTENTKLLFFTKTDIANFSHFFKPFPDVYIAIEENGEVTRRYFFDLFDGSVKRSKIRKRIEQYVEYFVSNDWEEKTTHPFPSILLVAPNKDMKDYLYRVINAILSDEGVGISFFLATKRAIQAYGVKKDTWQKVE